VRIFAINDHHDGATACIEDGKLAFSIEAEKDSGPRYGVMSDAMVLRNLARLPLIPDVLAHSGWGDEYMGLEEVTSSEFDFPRTIRYYRTTHERAHIWCSYGLSPLPQGQPCYVLVWEGTIGSFYKIDRNLGIEKLGTPIPHPGHRYQTLWALAHAGTAAWYEIPSRHLPQHAVPAFQRILTSLIEQPEGPGKMMALSAFADASSDQDRAVTELVEFLTAMEIDGELMHEPHKRMDTVLKLLASWQPFRHLRIEDQVFKNIVNRVSLSTFDAFYKFARENMRERLPLLISGGCGLNCTWNTNWKECGLFPDTFVPPCTNDSGISIGTAIDAQLRYTGNAKLEWNVMAGEEFVRDVDLRNQPGFAREKLEFGRLAQLLARGAVVGWVQGRYEIGPRALGHRSILAAPFDCAMHTRLNQLKKRESYRPVAPICLEEDVSEHFQWTGASPYMLYFQKVKSDKLKAVTHVDGTARVQTVSPKDNDKMCRLLRAFRKETGFGVLCNTSLNFKGKGFINRSSDLMQFASQEDVDAVVVGDDLLVKRGRLNGHA